MLIGFIVVIVMILVIVGLMATGNSSGGTGVNQTKATKVVTEIGTLAQSLAFYKTTTAAGDYTGFDQAAGDDLLDGYSVDGALVAADVKYTADDAAAGAAYTAGPASADASNLIKSQAVPNVLYAVGTDSTNANLVMDVILGTTANPIDNDLADTIGDTVFSKLNTGNMAVTGYGPTTDLDDPYANNSSLEVTVK